MTRLTKAWNERDLSEKEYPFLLVDALVCGDCCKKVINGSKLFFVFGLAVLLPAKGDCLFVKLFSSGKLVDKDLFHSCYQVVSNGFNQIAKQA